MTITINGSGTIDGITAGGLPDAVIQTADIVDLAVTPAKMSQKLTSGTSVASTSGTSIDFTSIPSWVKRVTVMFNGVSTNGTSGILIQIGSGSFTTTGYNSTGNELNNASGTGGISSTSGFCSRFPIATDTHSGHNVLTLISGNTWIYSGIGKSNTTTIWVSGGDVSLGGALDRVRITTVNGTDTFDAGSINIMYEG